MAAHNNVVISSTVLDLPNHRREVMDACIRLDLFPRMMEHRPATDAGAIRDSLELVNNADIYVGVFAHRYGHIPVGYHISITEMEYDRAVERNITRSIFIMGNEHPITIGDVDLDQTAKLKALKERLNRENTTNSFSSPADLRAQVIYSLSQLLKRDAIRLQLTGQQKRLYEALIDREAKLGRMYLGAIAALEQRSNPERLVSAGHLIREMMEKLPKYLDLPAQGKPMSLREKVQELLRKRDNAVQRSSCHPDGSWKGQIDGSLQGFLDAVDEFFEWFADVHPNRRERISSVIRRLDPSGRSLPEPLANKQIELWDAHNSYFQGVSHHTIDGSDLEFESKLSVLEGFLLDRLLPRTFDDFARLDDLIREGEKGD